LRCYDAGMTSLDIQFRYANPPTEATVLALSGAREVYGIRRLNFDRDARIVLVEYDATRLNGAMVAGLLRRAGLEITEELALIPPPAPEPVEAPATAAKA
jgi:hypothetical protein